MQETGASMKMLKARYSQERCRKCNEEVQVEGGGKSALVELSERAILGSE